MGGQNVVSTEGAKEMSREKLVQAAWEIHVALLPPNDLLVSGEQNAVAIIERLLAQERELMECGHPKACLIEREITNIEKNEGPLNDTEYCSACAEREKVRDLCVGVCESRESWRDWDSVPELKYSTEAGTAAYYLGCKIRQLDLTTSLAPSTDGGKEPSDA